jgi:hypothetical protein
MNEREKLTKELATNELLRISSLAADPEAAHSEEDNLHSWFIACIADGLYQGNEAQEVAQIIIKTGEIDFPRWCA